MPSQIILNMYQVYPFGSQYISQKRNQEVLVQKVIFHGNKQQLLRRIKFFQKLRIPHTIKIISVFQNEKSIEIYYEYVGVKFEIWMKNMSVELQENLQKQLYAISGFLAANKISAKFNPQQIGLDKDYHIKYFIDIENAFHDLRLNSEQLKMNFDREIQAFLRSIDSRTQKIITNKGQLGSELKLTQQLQKFHLSSAYRNLDRTFSVKTFDSKHNQPTQASSNQFQCQQTQLKPSISPLNKLQVPNFSDKIKNIKERFELVKKKSAKMNRSVMDMHYYSRKNKQVQSQNALLWKKTPNLTKTHKGVSFQQDVQNAQESPKMIKMAMQHHSENQRQNSEKSLSFSLKEEKKIKSQKFRTPKNSDSHIEYLDMVRSPSAYVLDFLNVLQDPSQSEHFEQKCEISQDQSQSSRQKDDLMWKSKVNQVIENSRNLISRLRTPSRLILN